MGSAIVRQYTDEHGRALVEYESGAIKEQTTGLLVGSKKPLISADNAREMVARRQAKAAAAARQGIINAVNAANYPGASGLPVKVSSSSAAVGLATQVLWETGVLNPDERLSDRVKAFESTLKVAQLANDSKQQPAPDGARVTMDMDAGTAERVILALARMRGNA